MEAEPFQQKGWFNKKQLFMRIAQIQSIVEKSRPSSYFIFQVRLG